MTDEQKNKKDEQEAQVPPVPAPSTAEMEQTHADELAALQQAQADELGSLQQVNEQRYKDVGDIVAEAEAKLGTMKVDDETAQKRSEAFRYIAGLGDTLSGLANVVGTSFGAQNQQQTYNGGYVAEKAEQARKERKLEMDKISSRLDEMRAREKDLKASGSLAEAELKAKQAREKLQLNSQQRSEMQEAKRYSDSQTYRAERDAKEDWYRDRAYNRGVEEFNETMEYNKSRNTQQDDKDKGRYEEFNLGGGEFVQVPQSRMNEYNIVELFDLCPDGIKETAGKPKIDSYGAVVGYYPPTQKEMLQAINRAAQNNPAIKDRIRNLGKQPEATQEENKPAGNPVIGAKSGTDWSANEVKQG